MRLMSRAILLEMRIGSALVDKGLLVAGSHNASLRLGFPIDVVERWFPKLYPVT